MIKNRHAKKKFKTFFKNSLDSEKEVCKNHSHQRKNAMPNNDSTDIILAVALVAVLLSLAVLAFRTKRTKLVEFPTLPKRPSPDVNDMLFLNEKIMDWAKTGRRYRPFRFNECAIAFPAHEKRELRAAIKTLLYKGYLRQKKAGWLKVN